MTRTLLERFEAKYIPEPMSGCWLWTAFLNPAGYGQIGVGGRAGRPMLAHRVAWEMHRAPIPEGLVIDHLCRNPACINPDHLQPVAQKLNLLRGNTFNARNVAKTHCLQGHPLIGENLYLNSHGGRHCQACRKRNREAWRRRSKGVVSNAK